MEKTKPKQKSSLQLVSQLIYLLAIASSLLFVVGLLESGVLPLRYALIMVFIYVAVLGVLAWAGFRRKQSRATSIFVLVAAVLLTCANIYGYGISRDVQDFFAAVQRPDASYVEYTIFAGKDQPVNIKSARTMAMISSDPLYGAAKSAAASETPATVSIVGDLTSLTEAVRTKKAQLGVSRSAYLDILKQNHPEFYQSITVLGTFRVQDNSSKSVRVDVAKPFVVYISGIDTYGDIAKSSLSDVNMLAVVNPQKRTMLLVNTPRDYYVQLHGTTGALDKLTHAGVYGIDSSRQTLEDLYAVEIPYYVRMNFTSLVKLVDTIGPIEVQSDYAFKSFTAGKNVLDSKQALEFARERYSFADGDRQRGRNQQLVIEAIVAKLSEPKNITRYSAILRALESSIQTDIDRESLTAFVRMQLDDMKRWRVESISVDGTGDTRPTYSMGSLPLYVMIPNQQTVELAKTKIDSYLAP